jgi:N-acetylglucosaminyl-diphospho-decaprenol L-rhamnosyltransferase
MNPSRLSVVIVNFNTREMVLEAIASIMAAVRTDDEVCVIDNCSTDGSGDAIRAAWPSVQLITNTVNRGFGPASNQGARATTAPHVLMFGPDARIERESLEALRAILDHDQRVGVVGSRLTHGTGEFQRWTAGRPVTLVNAVCYFFLLDRFASRWPRFEGIFAARDLPDVREVGWVTGAVMLLRRSAFEAVGMFDERMFLYMEDVDLCHRLRQGGYTVMYAGSVTATHHIGSSEVRTSKASPLAIHALISWYARMHKPIAAWLFRLVVVVGFAIRSAGFAMAGIVRPRLRVRARAHFTNCAVALKAAL